MIREISRQGNVAGSSPARSTSKMDEIKINSQEEEHEKLNLKWYHGRNVWCEDGKLNIYVYDSEIEGMTCQICENYLSWKLDSDSETPHYFSKCCGREYQLWPTNWRLEIINE